MSNVIQFPDRKSENISVVGFGPIEFGNCTEVVHYFDETPGICHCHKTFWDPPNDPVDRPRALPDAPQA